jgi:hypothetical protein
MTGHQAAAGTLAPALAHFRKATRSDWQGLFACESVPSLPRMHNALEQYFGAYRSHERRATGRQGASPGLVLRGAVRLVAAMASRLCSFAAADLVPENVSGCQALHQEQVTRRRQRTLRRRFRCDPPSYLAQPEADLLQQMLPPEKTRIDAQQCE